MTPGRPDPAVIRRHLWAIDDALRQLRRHQHGSLDDLVTDRDRRWAVERGLQLCAQNALDVATHIAAASGRDVADYATALDVLADLTVLPREFAARFRGVAGFRNVLVHGYLDLDLAVAHRLLQTGLDDFVTFAEHVSRYLESLPPS
jgi:uncharacterized protein YutE (UPF0331/DUF86 family)